jgi:formate hydrogenlyase transcriptional activator
MAAHEFLSRHDSKLESVTEREAHADVIPVDRDKLGQRRTEEPLFDAIIGRHGGLHAVFSQIRAVAPTEVSVLLTGETGTGKEVVARAIHELSPRRKHKLVKLNCAAIPGGLLASELFGHEKGAFTGAVATRAGRFALADRGTLFLDEIGDIALELQPKLLRVLQEREFEPLGSTRTLRANVRVVAATHRNLLQMVRDEEFREDLYYRLNIFPIHLPPLRERKTDIPDFVRFFVERFSVSINKSIDTIPKETMQLLVSYPWPGNIRELENYVARGVVLAKDRTFAPEPPKMAEAKWPASQGTTLEDTTRAEVLKALQVSNWRIGGPRGAATRLGLKRTTLSYKMRRLGITLPPAENCERY